MIVSAVTTLYQRVSITIHFHNQMQFEISVDEDIFTWILHETSSCYSNIH